MRIQVIFMLFVLCIALSCDNISIIKKQNIPTLDTIVDFSSVDTSPSFSICDSIIEKEPKTNCFRKTIHKSIAEELQRHVFAIEHAIDETILVYIKIDAKGIPRLVQIDASNLVKQQLPNLDSILQNAVNKLPKLYPAIKRGIPVETQYQLPLKIQMK